LNNLNSDVNDEEIMSDNEVVKKKNEFDNIEMKNNLEISQIAFTEDMKDL